MNKIIDPSREQWPDILRRPTKTYEQIEQTVNMIFEEVARNGDEALKKYVKKFDKADLKELMVQPEELVEADKCVSEELKTAIKRAKNNIEVFHNSQKTISNKVETTNGVVCWQEKRPIEKVGLYIPGGSAPLFSTILMLAVPAVIAGCEELIMCTPCDEKGCIPPVVLYTANLCGIKKIYKLGGIQAIAGMTFGTESVTKVYKLFGPGNQYVTVAKQMALKYGLGIDLPAGPSELLVYVDASANASFMAADLLSQAEHGEDSQVILVSRDMDKLLEIEKELLAQLNELPRKEIAEKAVENSKLIYCSSENQAIDLINTYAPEHLIINTQNNENVLPKISNAGSVFVGNYTPESAGDYASGTNHTLPTNGFAKNFSGVNLESFQKTVTFQEISSKGLMNIGNTIELMAEAEGLFAHKNAVSLRLEALQK